MTNAKFLASTGQNISSIGTLRRFRMCRFPRLDFKWNPWLLMLFCMILAKKQSSTVVLDLICTVK